MNKIAALMIIPVLLAAGSARAVEVDSGIVFGQMKVSSVDFVAKYYCKIGVNDAVIEEDVAKVSVAAHVDKSVARLFMAANAQIVAGLLQEGGQDGRFCDLARQTFSSSN